MVTLDGKTGKVIEQPAQAPIEPVRQLPDGDYELPEVVISAKKLRQVNPLLLFAGGLLLALIINEAMDE